MLFWFIVEKRDLPIKLSQVIVLIVVSWILIFFFFVHILFGSREKEENLKIQHFYVLF